MPTYIEPPKFFYIEPMQGESISHFLGRFRRRNHLSAPGTLGRLAGISTSVGKWEKLLFSPSPKPFEVEALAAVVGVAVERLVQMFPSGAGIRSNPIWLCGACYTEEPCHQIEWQSKLVLGCERHKLRFLSECLHCGKPFDIPSLWLEGVCQRCFLPFSEMVSNQKPY